MILPVLTGVLVVMCIGYLAVLISLASIRRRRAVVAPHGIAEFVINTADLRLVIVSEHHLSEQHQAVLRERVARWIAGEFETLILDRGLRLTHIVKSSTGGQRNETHTREAPERAVPVGS